MSNKFMKDLRYDLTGQEEINFLHNQGHSYQYIFNTLLPLHKKGRRRWKNRIHAKESYERNKASKKHAARSRSALHRATVKNMGHEEAEYHMAKKKAQQREWRERNRTKLAEKARLRRQRLRCANMTYKYATTTITICDTLSRDLYLQSLCSGTLGPFIMFSAQHLPHTPPRRFRALTPDSPLPPSDPPSPTSSDIDDVNTPPTRESPPRLPPDWRQHSAANEYRPARNAITYWNPPPLGDSTRSTKCSVSHPEEIRRTALSRRRNPKPILYSFQQPDYRVPSDYAERDHFLTSVAWRSATLTVPNKVHNIPNVKPPCNLQGPQLPTLKSSARSLTSQLTRSNRGTVSAMTSPIHRVSHQRPLTASSSRSFSHDEAPPLSTYTKDPVIISNTSVKELDRQERGRMNARRYYQRHQKERLAKAAEYRKMKRELLAKCSSEDQEEILTRRQIKQREYTAPLKKARTAVTTAKRKLGTARAMEGRLRDQIDNLTTKSSLTSLEHEELSRLQAQLTMKSAEIKRCEEGLTKASQECTRLEAGEETELNVSPSLTPPIVPIHSSSRITATQSSEIPSSHGDIEAGSPMECGEDALAKKRKGEDLPQTQSLKRVRFAVAKSGLKSTRRTKKQQREVLVGNTVEPFAVTTPAEPPADVVDNLDTTSERKNVSDTSLQIVMSSAKEVSSKENVTASTSVTHDNAVTPGTMSPVDARSELAQGHLGSPAQIQRLPGFSPSELPGVGEQSASFVDLELSSSRGTLDGPPSSVDTTVTAADGPVSPPVMQSESTANHQSETSAVCAPHQKTLVSESHVHINSSIPFIVPSNNHNAVREGELDPAQIMPISGVETGMCRYSDKVSGFAPPSSSVAESSSVPNAGVHHPSETSLATQIGLDLSGNTSPGTFTSPLTRSVVDPTAAGAKLWPQGVPGLFYSTPVEDFFGESSLEKTRACMMIPVFDVNRMYQPTDPRISTWLNGSSTDSFQFMDSDIASGNIIPPEFAAAASGSSMVSPSSSTTNNASNFNFPSSSGSWSSNAEYHNGSNVARDIDMAWGEILSLQPENTRPSGAVEGNEPRSEEQKYPRDAHYVIPQNWNPSFQPTSRGDSTDIYTTNVRNSQSWNGISFRTMMEYLLRPRQPKATEEGLEMNERMKTAFDYWNAAWDAQFSKAAMVKAGKSKKRNKKGKKKANKAQNNKQKTNETDEDDGLELKSPGWFKRKSGETLEQFNTRMENEANHVVPIFLDNPYNFNKQLLP
ncbi:hypothetical protein VNI00_017168, partial [Paramarasmius palmivorus]